MPSPTTRMRHLIGGLWVDVANQQHGFLVQD
jgi:hypothetical protein